MRHPLNLLLVLLLAGACVPSAKLDRASLVDPLGVDAFGQYDLDDDGYLDRGEFAVTEFDPEAFDRYDLDDDDRFSRDEFLDSGL